MARKIKVKNPQRAAYVRRSRVASPGRGDFYHTSDGRGARLMTLPSDISACSEPLLSKDGPVETNLDRVTSPLPTGAREQAWARAELQAKDQRLQALAYCISRQEIAQTLMDLAFCHLMVGELRSLRKIT